MLYKRPFFIIRFLFMKHIIDIDTWERRDNYGFFFLVYLPRLAFGAAASMASPMVLM